MIISHVTCCLYASEGKNNNLPAKAAQITVTKRQMYTRLPVADIVAMDDYRLNLPIKRRSSNVLFDGCGVQRICIARNISKSSRFLCPFALFTSLAVLICCAKSCPGYCCIKAKELDDDDDIRGEGDNNAIATVIMTESPVWLPRGIK